MKKQKFSWGTVELLTGSNGTCIVKALIYGDSGLCINQYDPAEPKGKFIAVSHINTGCRLGMGFYTHKVARLYCEAAADLWDWPSLKFREDGLKYPQLIADIRKLREIVVEHKAEWKRVWFMYKLNGGKQDENE
jgi:hypothetical protein